MQNYLAWGKSDNLQHFRFYRFGDISQCLGQKLFATALAGLRQINALHYADQSILDSRHTYLKDIQLR